MGIDRGIVESGAAQSAHFMPIFQSWLKPTVTPDGFFTSIQGAESAAISALLAWVQLGTDPLQRLLDPAPRRQSESPRHRRVADDF